MELSDVGLDLSQFSILRAIASYDGHLVGTSRTGSGKTTVMLAALAGISQSTNGGADFFCGSGKASVWMGLEQQTAKDGMPRVINVSLSKPESIEPLVQRLRWAVAIQEEREILRIEKTIANLKVNPRPLYFVLDEWLIILKVAKKYSKQAYVELIDLVECLIFKGRQDKCFLWLFAQGHQCGSLHLDKDCRRNLGVIALGGGGNFESVAAAIGDSDLVENAGDRSRLQSEYQSLIAEGSERIYYSSIGGHKVSLMDVLPDMEALQLFPPDKEPLVRTPPSPPSVTTRVLDHAVAASSSPPSISSNFGKPPGKPQPRVKLSGVSPDAASPERNLEPKPVGNNNPEVKRLEQLLENGTYPTDKKTEEFEKQKIKIQQDHLKLEREKHHLDIAKTRAAIVDLHLSAEAKWNLITLGFGILVFIIYAVPMFSGALQELLHFTRGVGDGVGPVVKKVDKTVDYWAPNLGRSPAAGDKIAGYTVTSPYGPRDTPTEGASSFHHGADEAMPIGTPLHAIGNSGEKVSVRCFQDRGGGLVAEYHSMGWIFQNMHLSRCAGGEHLAGSIIASSGNSGISTGPHLHFGQKKNSGEPVAPQTGYIWWAITGDQPQPVTSKLEGSGNKECGLIKAGYKPNPQAQIQVASIQSLVRRKLPPAGLVIVDECHHSAASTYRKVLDAYPEAKILGVSATPNRIDGYGLRDVFEYLIQASAFKASVGDLIADGYLAPFRLFGGFIDLHMGNSQGKGDYSAAQLGKAVHAIDPQTVVSAWLKTAPEKKTCLFAINIPHSQAIVSEFLAQGIRAYHLDGESPNVERRDALARFESGEITVLSNVGLFTFMV